MRIHKRDVYTSRFFRTGKSWAIVIPPDLCEIMGLRVGDQMLMNFTHGVCWLVKATPGMIVSRETVARIFDELFPDKEELHRGE
jgi:antitoxin component of MazEF toxin-antitoxin module